MNLHFLYLRRHHKLLSQVLTRKDAFATSRDRIHTTPTLARRAASNDSLGQANTDNINTTSSSNLEPTPRDIVANKSSPQSSPEIRKDYLASTRRLPAGICDSVLRFGDVRNQVYKEILHPEESMGVLSTVLPALNSILKGHRPGELTILTGPTGGGKTTVMSQLSLDYCKSGVPTFWGSFEILNQRLVKKMLYQFAGKNLSQHPDELDTWANEFGKLPLYFLKFFSSTAINTVLDACQFAVDQHRIQHIILDNLQFMLSQQGKGSLDRWELQDHGIHELRSFATTQSVHISLVVHPRKDSGGQMNIDSVFGSAKITQEADNVIILQKEGLGGEHYIDIKKNRYDGTTGVIPYTFDRESLKIQSRTKKDIMEKVSSSSLSRSSQSSTERIAGKPFRSSGRKH